MLLQTLKYPWPTIAIAVACGVVLMTRCMTEAANPFTQPSASAAPTTRPSARVEKFLGPRTIAILDKADRVGVFRLKDTDRSSEQMSGYPIVDIGKEQGRAFGADLVAVLYDERTYNFESAKACKFTPGVGFRLMSNEGSVDVVLCFQCNELKLFTTDGKQKDVEHKHEDFDGARPALVKLAKAAFPDDKQIQSLQEK